MTREEAINILKAIRVYECYPKSASEETKEAIDMAIETLSAAAVTHGRLIDADRLKSYIDCGHLRPPTEVCFSELDVCNMIDKAPTVSAEAVHKPDYSYEAGMVRRLKEALSAEARPTGEWIPVSERLPECEQEVLICTEKKLVGKDAYIDSIITPAIYEDGTMLEVESMWSWHDIDFDEWDDTEDCGIIPMGWFENRHFNPDEVYNNPVDRKVVAWMPLPEPYKAERGGEE